MALATLYARRVAALRAYLKTTNATNAAIEAGYSENGARQEGSRLLTNVDLRAAVAPL